MQCADGADSRPAPREERPAQGAVVTVVTVTRDDLGRLQRTAASIDQQKGSFEWLVVDGGSTDGTVEWLESLADERVRWITEPDEGIYDAMNKGLNLARGEYVNFLNAGDRYLRATVLADVERRAGESAWEWGHGRGIVVDADGRQVRPVVSGYPGRIRHALGPGRLIHQTVFARTSALLGMGGFDRRFPIAADVHLIMRLGARSAPLQWSSIDVAYEEGGISDQDARRSLQDLHNARVDVFGLGKATALADSMWTEGVIAYVRSRRMIKRSARRVLGERSIDWWARR